MGTIEILQFQSLRAGLRLIVTGAVHGNETCGTQAIRQVAASFASGDRQLSRGTLTLVPICNPVAYASGRREGDRNLNRDFRPTVYPENAEDRIVNRLAPLLADHDVLVDLHSFAAPGEAFVFAGPQNNDGDLEPFRQEQAEGALALAAGPDRIVYGWLSTYASGAIRRAHGRVAYGIGTTEYMRHRGGIGITVECGQHACPAAPGVARAAIDHALALLGLEDAATAVTPPDPNRTIEVIELIAVHDRLDPADRFAAPWRSFDRIARDQVIAWRADGAPIAAPEDGYIVFPNSQAVVGREWFYFAHKGARLFK